jgi:hypothetical protein
MKTTRVPHQNYEHPKHSDGGVSGTQRSDWSGYRARRQWQRRWEQCGLRRADYRLSLDTLKEARWQADRDLFVKRAQELGAKVDVQSANSDDNQQIRDVESLLTSGAKVLVIVPHDGVAMARAVEMAHKVGVPVISYDRLIRNADVDLYLSFDNVKVGEQQAEFLVSRLPGGKGRIVRVYGSPTDNNAKLFKQGQDNILNPLIKKGDIKVVREDWAEDWRPENAKRIVNAAITDTGRKIRRGSGFQRRHSGWRDSGSHRSRQCQKDDRHGAGCRTGRLPAHRTRYAKHDHLQTT